jgi:hypothetical protein
MYPRGASERQQVAQSSMLGAGESQRRKERAQRFKEEAKKGAPALPKKTFAHPGGKIVTSDKDAALAKLFARKQAAGEALTEAQQRALDQMNAQPAHIDSWVVEEPDGDSWVVVDNGKAALVEQTAQTANRATAASASAPEAVKPADKSSDKRVRALRKKLRDIETLEERQREGAVLQQNQLGKLEGKSAIEEELRAALAAA